MEGDTESFLSYMATQFTKEEYDICKYFVFLVVTVPFVASPPMPSFVFTDIAPLMWVDPRLGIVVLFVINQSLVFLLFIFPCAFGEICLAPQGDADKITGWEAWQG